MTELKPTPGQVELLKAVAKGAVTERSPLSLQRASYIWWDHGPDAMGRQYQTVTGRIKKMYKDGWVRLGDRIDSGYNAPRRFDITGLGQAVLARVEQPK